MSKPLPEAESKSAERIAFDVFLRTGRRVACADLPERKFNPYHDPRNGQFTFAPGGPKSISNPIFSDRRGLRSPIRAGAKLPTKPQTSSYTVASGERTPAKTSAIDVREAAQRLNQFRPNRRARTGGNGGPPLNDPLTITQAIPALQNSPAGSIVAVPAELFGLTGPARDATGALHDGAVRNLIRQIKAIDPGYHYENFGPAQTLQGRINEINKLRLDRSIALYRVRGDASALQVEVMRFLQTRVDAAYEEGLAKYAAGDLTPRLSRNEAIGNYIDRAVRTELSKLFNWYRIDHSAGPIRVIGRAYDSSKNPPTYVIPDAAVANVAFDWSLARKTPGRRQVRGFFASDFRPDLTVIVRPSQLGLGHTYAIKARRN